MRHLSLGLLALLSGCSSIFGPDEERVVGIIPGLGAGEPEIEVPATALAGQEFTITVHTAWPDGCSRKGTADVRQEAASALITPYDVVTKGDLCAQQPQRFTHTATLVFDDPGTVEVTVRGRATRSAGVTAVRRTVVVQ